MIEKAIETAGVAKKLFENRTLFLSSPVTSEQTKTIVSALFALDLDDPSKPITFFQNSPGGEVHSGFAIYDAIKAIKAPVSVVNTGLCASIATIINVAVPKERRYSLPNCEFMIHQPLISGQIRGQASDLEITAKEMDKTRAKLNSILAEACGQSLDKVENDTKRDYWMSSKEALEYGLIGSVIESVSEIRA